MAKSEKTKEKVQPSFQIAVLFEGTGLDGDSSSNVGRLARTLVRDERQHVILKHGSGTYPFTHIGGRIAGTDAMRILSDAYAQLARVCAAHVGESPRVFLFGFSRGALYARVLAACLVEIGVAVVPSDAKRIFKAWRSDDKESELARFRQKGCLRPVDVYYIGAWDTVDATVGIDGVDFIDVPRAVHVARHAVAINEYRGHFDYVPMRGKQVIERFFAGSHTDVGGGYKDHALADVAGAWVVRGALRQGLRLKEGVKLSEAFPAEPIVHNSLGDATNFWGALEAVRRKIDPKRLHRSVRKILSRILDQDGNPAPPEIFRDAPTA